MNPEHKKYIIENQNKKSIKEIASYLCLKERVVKRLLEREASKHKKEIDKNRIGDQDRFNDYAPALPRFFNIAAIFIIFSVITILYLPSLSYNFVWDDKSVVLENELIKSFRNFPSLFTHTWTEGKAFRPVYFLTYMIDWHFWKDNPYGYHLSNIAFGILASIALYFLLCNILRSKLKSFIIVFLFSIHPVAVEVITYISGRTDSLYVIFFCLSFLCFIKSSSKISVLNIYAIMSQLFFLICLLSKEAAIVLPLLAIGHGMWINKQEKRQILKRATVVYILPIILYFVLRIFIISNPHIIIQKPENVIDLILLVPRVIFEYIVLVLFPQSGMLHMGYLFGPYVRSIHEINYYGYYIVFFIVAMLSIFSKKYKHPFLYFGYVWFFINIIPVLNIFKEINAPFAVHWAYLPSVGILIVAFFSIVYIFESLKLSLLLKRCIAISIIILMSGYLSYQTVKYSLKWKDNLSIYQYTVEKVPRSIGAISNFALALQEKGHYAEALQLYKSVLETNPNNEIVKNNIEVIYEEMKEKQINTASPQ